MSDYDRAMFSVLNYTLIMLILLLSLILVYLGLSFATNYITTETYGVVILMLVVILVIMGIMRYLKRLKEKI